MKSGNLVPNPILRFEDGGYPDYGMAEVHKAGFAAPTLQDMVEIAQTGYGKTLGYLLPGIIHCNNQPYLGRGDDPIVLVLAPTR